MWYTPGVQEGCTLWYTFNVNQLCGQNVRPDSALWALSGRTVIF